MHDIQNIAGVDEAGAGCLAGPVVAASAMLKQGCTLPKGLDDSKKLTAKKRESLYDALQQVVDFQVQMIEADEIDEINILAARMRAMELAVKGMSATPDYCLIDGHCLPKNLPCDARAIIKGDASEPIIAAASIIAKVTRDRLMVDYATKYPEYGFDVHKGYGTKQHLHALETHGITPLHRKTYAPVRRVIEQQSLFEKVSV